MRCKFRHDVEPSGTKFQSIPCPAVRAPTSARRVAGRIQAFGEMRVSPNVVKFSSEICQEIHIQESFLPLPVNLAQLFRFMKRDFDPRCLQGKSRIPRPAVGTMVKRLPSGSLVSLLRISLQLSGLFPRTNRWERCTSRPLISKCQLSERRVDFVELQQLAKIYNKDLSYFRD